ncbi:MAG TPA: hypothetical protein VGQ51_14980 [Puia sp.]|jgi:hypothetical protein|nr:hypothetical protein [Puia sp.]
MGLFDQTPTGPANDPLNTNRIKTDIETVIQSMASGNPDTEKIKEAGSDLLNTAASILSNQGIDQLTGGGAPEEAAGGIFKRLRDGLGLDSHALDGLKQAAEQLKNKL